MEKYEKHGLTREEDDLLGAFGRGDTAEAFPLEYFAGNHLEALRSLVKKGLLEAVTKNFIIEIKLTPKGLKLWHTRSAEEAESHSKQYFKY